MLSHFSHVRFFATLWTIVCQAPQNPQMGFSSQESWSGLLCPPPEELPNPGIKPSSLTSLALAGGFFTTDTTWEAQRVPTYINNIRILVMKKSTFPSIVKNISQIIVVLLEQQETRIARIILTVRVFSCDTTGKTHKKHKKQKNLIPCGLRGNGNGGFPPLLCCRGPWQRAPVPGPCSTTKM